MSTLLPNALSETLSSSCILGCASKRKVSAPEEDRPQNATAVETNSIAHWTAGEIAGPLTKKTLAEAGKFTKEATAKTEEAVAKTAVAFSATAELINTTMRASAKAAAAMLIRLSRSNNERAVAVLTHLIDTNKTNTKAMHEKTTRTAKLFEEVIKLHVQAAADLVIALMGRSAQSSEALMCTLVENSPTSAYQLLTVIISRGDTHAQQLFVYILRDRAANGMPLLTKMLPHLVPLLRKELCVRLKQKNVHGGIPLGPSPKRPLYHLRWVHTRRPKTRTEFGRRLQAETIPHDKLLSNLGVELRMTTETADAPALPALPLMELEYQPLHDDLLPPLPLPEPTSAPGSAHGSAPALAPHETVPAAVRQPSAADFDGLGVVVFDLNLRVVGTVGEEVGIALVGVGPLPNLFGQIRSFSGECNKLRVWWNLNEKTVRIAFCEPLTLELIETHVQLPICCGGKGDCYPASESRLLGFIIKKILGFVFRPHKPPRFSLKPKLSHWRTVRDIYRWHGAKGLGYRQYGMVSPKAKSALLNTGSSGMNWRGLANVGRTK